MAAVKLKTTDAQVNDLQTTVNEARKGSDYVRVPITSLRNLLLDHHEMAGKLNAEGER